MFGHAQSHKTRRGLVARLEAAHMIRPLPGRVLQSNAPRGFIQRRPLFFCLCGTFSPSRRRRCIEHVREVLGVSERRACRTLGQHRSTQRKIPCGLPDEERLTEDIIALTRDYGRYGYRMIAGMLNNSGWHVNHKRVERIWRREGLKVPHKQKKKGRL